VVDPSEKQAKEIQLKSAFEQVSALWSALVSDPNKKTEYDLL
jgi:hypothetical protein